MVSIEVPPLRARPSDVPLLAHFFLHKYARENAKEIDSFSDGALERMCRYHWPGNVRELENAIERAVVVCRGPHIRPEDLSPAIVPSGAPSGGMPPVPGSTLGELEKYAILKTLEHTGGSTSRAAEILKISPRKIQYKLHEYQNGTRSGAPPLRDDDLDDG